METPARTMTNWRIVGEETGSCNCAWGCPCQFNALPTYGRCEALVDLQIREGYFGDTRLDGVSFASIFSWPGAIHEGNGTRQLILDERDTPEQHQALLSMTSGSQGGTVFEIFAAVCPNVLEPIFAPISLESDRERRVATLHIPGVGESRIEPIKNPVTGEEHRARIVLPNGFEYKEAEMGNTVYVRVHSGEKVAFEHENTYAQLNVFEWSNE
jgi:hypothetical protein